MEVGDKFGYDSLMLSDRIVSDRFSLNPMVALSVAVGFSDRMKFGTSVLALPLRNPVLLARQIATLHYLSRGHFFPAVGLGQEEPEGYEACWISKKDRAQRTEEAIVLMRRLWEDDSVTHEGKFIPCHNVNITPKPVYQPSPPVWIGSRSPAAARRAGRVGNGWLVSSITPQEIREGRQIVFETAQQHRRSVEEDHIAVLLEFYIAPDTAQAATRARPFVTRHCPDAPFTEYSALGPGERIIEWIQRYIEAGGCKFVVRPLCPEDETMEQLEMLGRKVLPRFHKK